MKHEKNQQPSGAELKELLVPQSTRRALRPSEIWSHRALEKVRTPFRKLRWWLQRFVWGAKNRLKHHYHIHLMLKYEQRHWLADSIFGSQTRSEKQRKKIEELLGTLPRKLVALQREMEGFSREQFGRERKFRGQFAKIAREHRGLSRKQVCRLLNSHRDLIVLGRRHHSYWFQFPFTPSFIEKFEENTGDIFEEITQGFLFGAGFPTQDFLRWLAQIYRVEDEFAEFQIWYEMLLLKKVSGSEQ